MYILSGKYVAVAQRNRIMSSISVDGIGRDFYVVEIEGEGVLSVAVSKVGEFNKYYLGKRGLKKIPSFIGDEGMAQLKPGWENARFAVVVKEGMTQVLGVVVEYEDGTLVMFTRYPDNPTDQEISDFNRLTSEYIKAETSSPSVVPLKGWEDVPSGAAIKEAFTSRRTDTGLWGQSVPVVNFDCTGSRCLRCIAQCPDESLTINPVTKIVELFDTTKCKACGICVNVCSKNAVTLVQKTEVKSAQPNVFTGIYGKRFEIRGDAVREEVNHLMALPPSEFERAGYYKLYEDSTGEKSLSGHRIIQVSCSQAGEGKNERPLVYTYISEDGINWRKIIRPLANILVYGMTEYELELASRMQLEGFHVFAVPSSADDAWNSMRAEFRKAGYTSELTLPDMIERYGHEYDAVVTAYSENIPKELYVKIMERIGVFLAPFMKNNSRDPYLDGILREVESKMPNFGSTLDEDDRPFARVLRQERDIAAGHRACSGCPIDSTFNLAMQSVRELTDTADEKIGIVNTGATGCAEVVTTIYPDTAWRKFLHTVFGAAGANLEGINAAYRFLRRIGKITRKFKFFGWAGDGGTYDIGLQSLSGFLERGLAEDSVYVVYDNGAYMNTGIQRSSATPMGAGTSTSPIGEIIRGKPQYRKNLADFATAHRGVYVATVSISHEMDFRRKLQKAAMHNGPALIIAYSNCTTGHGTATDVTVEQSSLAVESGYWPLFEIENGERKITYEPSFVRTLETAKLRAQNDIKAGKGKKQILMGFASEEERYREEFAKRLLQWLKSEGRFALHFNEGGRLKDDESRVVFGELLHELMVDWSNLRVLDRHQKRKAKLVGVLTEYLREKDRDKRRDNRGIGIVRVPVGGEIVEMTVLDRYIDTASYFDRAGIDLKDSVARLIFDIQRQLDPEVYFDVFGEEIDSFRLDKPTLTPNLRAIAERLYQNYFLPQIEKAALTHKAITAKVEKLKRKKKKERVEETLEGDGFIMDGIEKQKNRAVLGPQPIAGRIFARAGDGGVTSAKLFVSLLGKIGIFGKAAPDYGPERRGAPVGTNFQIGGRELRTQASYEELDISIVKDPDDPGWPVKQWRGAVKDGGVIIVSTPLTPMECRLKYNIPRTIDVYTFDAKTFRRQNKVPETVTLLGVAMRALSDKGVGFSREYLDAEWGRLLGKEFASKPKVRQIVEKNKLALWTAFSEAKGDSSAKVSDGDEYRKILDIRGYEQAPPKKLLTGSEAVAEAWRQINPGVFAMFPITPSTEVGQVFSEFWADGDVDTEYVHTESEHSSFMVMIAAAACGVRTVGSTASQGMLLGKEAGLLAATLRLPLIVNVGNRETNAPLSIHAGHTDAYQFRDDGWIHFFPRNAQEAYDFAIIAQRVAEKVRLPVFLNQDGFIVTHTKDMLDTLSDTVVKGFVGEYDPQDSLFNRDMTMNPVSLADYYSEHTRQAYEAQAAAAPAIDDVLREFSELTGRDYRRVKKYELDDAQVAIVCIGSTEGTAMDAVDTLRAQGIRAGMLSLKAFRPFPAEEIRESLKGVKTVIVMDRMGALGTELTPLATEIQSAIMRSVVNLEYGRGGRNTPRKLIEDIYRIGVVLGWAGKGKIDRKKADRIVSSNGKLRALLTEMEELKGEVFVYGFKKLILEGRFTEAFGPKEHIDVREKLRLRDIKLSIIENLVLGLTLDRLDEGQADLDDLLVILQIGNNTQKQKALIALRELDSPDTRPVLAYFGAN